ncbi:MAG: ankyrin repeat domain-containing protein, partial [Desulfomonile tiedjei]|nr:ankyrin repeat domain-containing protein [Desulfomonile tiedjei]
LIFYAENHCDVFPPSMDDLSKDFFDQCGYESEKYSHHSFLATKDRCHLIVFEQPGLWKDHTVAYLDLDTRGKWKLINSNPFSALKIHRTTEQQFREYISKLTTPTLLPEDRLVAAAESGDSQKVKAILGEVVSIDSEDQRGWTALTIAAQEGQSGVIEFLLSKGAKVDLRDSFGVGRTALMRACALGHTTIVETLLAHSADLRIKREDGGNALIDALPYPTIVKRVIEAGGDCNEQIQKEWSPSVMSPLIAACYGGHAESARLIIEHGADLKRDGLIALDAAARSGHTEAIDMLLSKGVKADKKTLGECLSSAYPHPQAIKKFISLGADLNTKCTCPGGRTALMIAAINGCSESVNVLIGAGADLNAKDDKGHTVLDLLLAETRSDDWLPRDSVKRARILGIVDTLRKVGAKESGLYVEWPEPR